MLLKRFHGVLVAVLSSMAPDCMAQEQACPVNLNFAAGTLVNWSVSTGLVNGLTIDYPLPNSGLASVQEYTIATTGIKVNRISTVDHFGKFPTVPIINGYTYQYSVQLGSTATSHDLGGGRRAPGGFTRKISYRINVPQGDRSVPYTITYAYALVLENGTHNSIDQPLFKATLQTRDSVVYCASPRYYLPTFSNTGSQNGSGFTTDATLDTAAALANGFTNSPEYFLSYSNRDNDAGNLQQDVWTKNWTEVTFDLSPYRGQSVTLSFEADNCTPGAHFAYAYVALRNSCGGLEISGAPTACINSTMTYSIPALPDASYQWSVPSGWSIESGASTNIIRAHVGSSNGYIVVRQRNSCTNLTDSFLVTTTQPTVAGKVTGDNSVCGGINNTVLRLTGRQGAVLDWLYTSDGVSWQRSGNQSDQFSVLNLGQTRRYAALVQNGPGCTIDTSEPAQITVYAPTVGGTIRASSLDICLGETRSPVLQLQGQTGDVANWQMSQDLAVWTSMRPAYLQTAYQTGPINTTTSYRVIVKNGVCPADTSAPATISFHPIPAPEGYIDPDSGFLCFGSSLPLTATITRGTSYTWSNSTLLHAPETGTVPSVPFTVNASASPTASTRIILSVFNRGCPTAFTDTLSIFVTPPIVVAAGKDTAVVIGQPVPLRAGVNTPDANSFSWLPATGLNNPRLADPVGNYNSSGDYRYVVTATTPAGCSGSDTLLVKVYASRPDIFVPNAFTPNGDGRNDQLAPICVGISQLQYFRIFNRWGQLVFSTTSMGNGWDGSIGGLAQAPGTYVYSVQGVDFNGRLIAKKGSLVLLR